MAMLLLGVLCSLVGCHLLRPPKSQMPLLSYGRAAHVLRIHDRDRSYVLYLPEKRAPRAPLVILLHASRQGAEGLRRASGYAFERLAEENGFVAVYPDAHGRRWNDCRAKGRYAARKLQIDDVGFLVALIDELARVADIDPARVFLVGYSSGAQLAFRVALERPERVAGVAAFSANLPTAENWACQGVGKPVPMMLVNGTDDRINPFEGGRVSVFGFASRGTVRSSYDSARYFAELAGLADKATTPAPELFTSGVARYRWTEQDKPEVTLFAVDGGGHVIPGPSSAFPRILGNVSRAFDGPGEAWRFFARQPPALLVSANVASSSQRDTATRGASSAP